jgi:CRISPR system Cascade subunit CasD
MQEYLVFRVYGPMASWGQPAVGGDRPTGMQPTRSAVLGLLGAALGIKRDQTEQLQQLQASILVGVKQSVPSVLMRDYHTTQVPSTKKNVSLRTRKEELEVDELNTILSSRDYRCDGLWIVAISLTEAGPFRLDQLQAALERPVFSLSLGRKSCPLALPVQPKIMASLTLRAALDREFPPITRSHTEDAMWLGHNGRVTYFWEGKRNDFDQERVLATEPWDDPGDRGRWQFKQRVMYQCSVLEDKNVPL